MRPNPTAAGKACPNQTKRNKTGWELTVCTPCSPVPVQHAKGQKRQHFGLAERAQIPPQRKGVPKSNQTKRNGVRAHRLLPRNRPTCQATPRQQSRTADRAQMKARMDNGNSPCTGTAPRAHSICQRPSPPLQKHAPLREPKNKRTGGGGARDVLLPRIHFNCHQTRRLVRKLPHPTEAARGQNKNATGNGVRTHVLLPRIRAPCRPTHRSISTLMWPC